MIFILNRSGLTPDAFSYFLPSTHLPHISPSFVMQCQSISQGMWSFHTCLQIVLKPRLLLSKQHSTKGFSNPRSPQSELKWHSLPMLGYARAKLIQNDIKIIVWSMFYNNIWSILQIDNVEWNMNACLTRLMRCLVKS